MSCDYCFNFSFLQLLFVYQGLRHRSGQYEKITVDFLLLANFFFTSERKQSFFWQSTSDNFFLCFVVEIFCRMPSLLCRLPFGVFSGQHIFHKFRQQTFSNFFFTKISSPTSHQLNPYSAGIDFRRQNLTSVDVRLYLCYYKYFYSFGAGIDCRRPNRTFSLAIRISWYTHTCTCSDK